MDANSLLNITSKKSGFESVFMEIPHNGCLNLVNPNCIKIFRLDIDSNKFSFASLHTFLQKNIGGYVFSRAQIDRFHIDDEVEAIGLRAIELLRQASNPQDKGAGGELGEILLYLYLEQLLNAPKLLSKMELKSSGNQYVYGCDGVHLLRDITTDGTLFHQLILGESKIKGDLKDAVDEAFKSITTFNLNHDADLKLIDTNIFKESFDEITTEYIKSLVIPSKRNLDINIDKAFGIFLGYTIDIDGSKYNNIEFRDKVKEKMIKDIEEIAPYIIKKINDNQLENNSFYFYVLPFNDAKTDRASVIKKLKGV